MHPRQLVSSFGRTGAVQSGYDSESSVVLLGIDDSSDSDEDPPNALSVSTSARMSIDGAPQAKNPMNMKRDIFREDAKTRKRKSTPKQAALHDSVEKQTAKKEKPLLVEVFSKHTGRWELGRTARRKVPGRIAVKFEIGGMPHIKTLKTNSRHLRMPEGIQSSCHEFVFNNNQPVLATPDIEDDSDAEGKVKRHDKLAQVELRNVVVSHQNSKAMPISEAMDFRWVSHGAFASKSHVGWAGFWDVRYVGPTDEDVVLKIFKSTHQKHLEDYEFIGFIHAMQFGSRSVRLPASHEEYYVGLEIHTGLNDSIFYGMSLHLQRRHMHRCCEMMMLDRPYKHRAEQCDFLVCLSKDASINHILMWRLQQFGTRSGPWGNEKRAIPICTDASLGLGLHFEDSVELCLGGRCFGRPCTSDTWFAELAEAAKQTTYGILTLDSESKYFYQTALGWIDVRRQYFYFQETDALISRREQHKYMLQSAPQLSLAAFRGDIAETEDVMQRDAEAKQAEDERQRTPLHYAALHGHVEVITQLLSVNADVESWSTAGNTPLHLAAIGGHEAVAGLLVRGGADANSRDFSGRSPLHFAAIGGHAWMVELLLSAGADVHTQDQQGDTPLDFALTPGPDVQHHAGHDDAVELLRKVGAERGKALRAAWALASATGGADDDLLAEALDNAKHEGVGSMLVDAAEARTKRQTCEQRLAKALKEQDVSELRQAFQAACDVGVDVKLTSVAEIHLTKLSAVSKIADTADVEDLIGLRDALAEARQVGANPDAIITGEESYARIVLKRKLKHAKKKGPEVLEKVLEEVYDGDVEPRNIKEAELFMRRLKATRLLKSSPQVQDGSLQKAIAEAKAAGVNAEDLVEAQSRLDTWESENALKEAMQTNDEDMILRAVTFAKKVGASDALVSAAKEKLSKLVLASKLVEASEGDDVIAVENALADAFAAGVDSKTLEIAQSRLKTMELGDQLVTATTSEQLVKALEDAGVAGLPVEKISAARTRLKKLQLMEDILAAMQQQDLAKLRAGVKLAYDAGLEPSFLGECVEALKRLEAGAGIEQAIQTGNVDVLSSNLVDARQSGAPATLLDKAVSHLKQMRLAETLEWASRCKDASILQELILPAQEAGVTAQVLADARNKLKGVVATSKLEKAMRSEDLETLEAALVEADTVDDADIATLDEARKHSMRLAVQQDLSEAMKNEDASKLKQLIVDGRQCNASPQLLIAARQLLRKLK